MSTRVKKSFSWFWMASLLVATTGVSLQQIYCYCLGKTTTVLFSSSAPCSTPAALPSEKVGCCKKDSLSPKQSCCKKKIAAAKSDRGCTKKTTKVFQMKTEFLVDKPVEKVKTFDFPLWINDFPILRRMSRPVICEAHLFHRALPPPPVSGRDLCVRYEFARC